jgi:flavorubredoxin
LPLAQRRLDYLVVVATGAEQVAALPRVLERFPLDNILWAGPPAGTYEALKLSEYQMERRIPVVQVQSGQALDLGAGARLEVLAATRREAVLL